MVSHLKVSLCSSLILALLCLGVQAQKNSTKLSTVVIDAGHGGKDPGCISGTMREKNITLSVALALGEKINKEFPDVKVVYTRSTDVYVGLYERGEIANKANADLFISIHVNAAKSTAASGVETFVMGIGKQQGNLEVAMKENDVISYEDDYTTKYDGYEPGSAESFIIFSLMQYTHLDQSMRFANMIQKEYIKNVPLMDRGVKQAGFLVLWKTAMPSILTEIGFISNAKDYKFITSDDGHDMIVKSIFDSFAKYKAEIDNNVKIVTADSVKSAEKRAEETTEKQAKNKTTESQSKDKNQKIIFSVQIISGVGKLDLTKPPYKEFKNNIWSKKVGNSYKYMVGREKSHKDALSLQSEVKRKFKSAFIVAFEGEEQINVNEAKSKIK